MDKQKKNDRKKLLSELQDLYNKLEEMKKSSPPVEQSLEVSRNIRHILNSLLEDLGKN